MGLFGFKKKKEIGSSKNFKDLDAPPPPAELGAGQQATRPYEAPVHGTPGAPGMQPPNLHQEPGSIPSPPPMPESKSGTILGQGKKPEKELPGFPQIAKPSPLPMTPKPTIVPGMHKNREEKFELPDFDDDELKAIESLEITEQKKKPRHKHKPKPEPKPVPEHKPKSEISYPREKTGLDRISEQKYVEAENYVSARQDLDSAGSLVVRILEAVDKHSETQKQEEQKQKSLIKDLNTIQDQFMIIDSKLFEGI